MRDFLINNFQISPGLVQPIQFFLALFIIFLGIVGLFWFLRRLGPAGMRLTRTRRGRLEIVESLSIDQRRRLVLCRCGESEHLLLIGGPADLVIARALTPVGAQGTVRPPAEPVSPPPGDDAVQTAPRAAVWRSLRNGADETGAMPPRSGPARREDTPPPPPAPSPAMPAQPEPESRDARAGQAIATPHRDLPEAVRHRAAPHSALPGAAPEGDRQGVLAADLKEHERGRRADETDNSPGDQQGRGDGADASRWYSFEAPRPPRLRGAMDAPGTPAEPRLEVSGNAEGERHPETRDVPPVPGGAVPATSSLAQIAPPVQAATDASGAVRDEPGAPPRPGLAATPLPDLAAASRDFLARPARAERSPDAFPQSGHGGEGRGGEGKGGEDDLPLQSANQQSGHQSDREKIDTISRQMEKILNDIKNKKNKS